MNYDHICQKYNVSTLSGADLIDADLSDANLRRADLINADLSYANLTNADLSGADLTNADLSDVDLSGANLSGADLSHADLIDADLSDANLRRADLRGADLSGADLRGAEWNYHTIGIHSAPEGDLIGWKKINNRIIKLLIPKEAQRSCATTRKFRCEYAMVLDIDGKLNSITNTVEGIETVYKKGERVYPDKWDGNRWNECSHGIHFFLTREEAENWA